jgi:predicted nucleotidyltransferase
MSTTLRTMLMMLFELTKFCMAAAKCNPTMLEILKSPIQRSTAEGTELVRLFPHVP